ncbi:hypothetical protein DB88DRAFT_488169 [Papiliotrema laurentii]|uniref:Cupin type-2 domain-containing protein n=1 Tax=Papiliotrema laurentii TaxID=5418 RepID=A0AAD9L7C0_PAPLA|nr:hypothetical protein DB88DRAFT_488169 [Papiliotrema laurentii]
MVLPPVFRHLTSRLKMTSLPPISSRLCELHPKVPLPNGTIPGRFHNLFVSSSVPPQADEPDLSDSAVGAGLHVAEGGINFRVTDVAPRTKGQMHRTPTIDFLVVHRGTITLHLEGDERVTVKEGEAVVQRATMHAWENETDEWVRMFVVLVAVA